MAKKKKSSVPSNVIPIRPLVPEPSVDPVKAFLQKDCFLCVKMQATLTNRTCVLRQLPKVAQKSAYTPQFKDSPPDAYCRSGQCLQGKKVKDTWEAKHGPMEPPPPNRNKRAPKPPKGD